MAYVTNITGPDYKGNYQALMSDGVLITFGPVQDPKYASPDAPETKWFVSLPSGKDHTTFIVSTRNGILETNSMWMISNIKAHGADKELWKHFADRVIQGLLAK